MARDTYFTTIGALAEAGNIPTELVSNEHLVYSSPATLMYNSPGAQGFGVKRAGVVIPESVMLVVAPACCSRNTTILADEGGYSERMFFLQMSENDLVTGRHLSDIPQAIEEIYEVCEVKPKVVVICITCVDALLGTDLERVCRKAEERTGIHVVPTYMYALMREGKNPPMVAVREAIYSLLEKRKPQGGTVNLLGNFTHLEDDSELYEILAQMGINTVHEVGRKETLEEYMEMGGADFNIILHPESRKAAFTLESKLDIPYIELTRVYEIDRIQRQYALFASALGVEIDDSKYFEEASEACSRLQELCAGKTFAIGQVVNGNSIEMALALEKLGLHVKSVFANISEDDFPFIKELAVHNPDLKVYSTMSPTMMNYDGSEKVDISIGIDAQFYYPESVNVHWNNEIQPFGYKGLVHFVEAVERRLADERA